MNSFLDRTIERARSKRQTIILPEGNDPRTLEAAEKIIAQDIADLIILGNPETIQQSGHDLSKAQIVDQADSPYNEELAEQLYEIRKAKGLTKEQAHELLKDPLYFGVMMVKAGHANGMVAGACHATSDVLRPALQILKTAPGAALVSSFFVMEVPDCDLGHQGTFIFADCGLNVQPDAPQLAAIALSSAASWQSLMDVDPCVALLSHSTHGSAKNEDADKVREATEIAKAQAPTMAIDGELQFDAAIIESVGSSKAPGAPVAGRANVLIFPDLDAGNIGYKLVQRLAKAEAYGPITQGIAAPVNDLSRGCSADDIVGVVAITCVQAQQHEAATQA